VTGDGDSKIFIANLERVKADTCTISFDILGTILLCRCNNTTLVEFFGGEVLGKNITDFVPELQPHSSPSDPRPTYLYLRDAADQRRLKNFNVKVKRDDGEVDMLLQVQAINVGINAVIFNATFKKLNPTMEVILLADSFDRIVACNSQVGPILGFSEDELIGKDMNWLLPEAAFNPPPYSNSNDDAPRKKRKSVDTPLPSIWREETGMARIIEVKNKIGNTMMVICNTLPVSQYKLSVILKKLEGTDQTSQELRTVGKYAIGDFIAAGNYGKVKRASRIDTGAEVAVKIINKKLMNEEEQVRAMREIEILKRLDHPNIIQFHEMIDTRERLYLFMEYIEGGTTLKKYIEKGLSEAEARDLFKQIAMAISYCHSMQVIHRDIKPTNVLIDGSGRAKLIDFGLSAVSEAGKLQGTFCGSPAFAPPEIILGTKYQGPAADVWCLGVLLYSMVANKLPFDCLAKILACSWVLPENVSTECCDLLSKMIVYDPNHRIGMLDVLNHPWLN